MEYKELRQFIKEANRAKLSAAEKDVFLYYYSRTQNDAGEWFCDDTSTAEEIGRSRSRVCEARRALVGRDWIAENGQFNIRILKTFSVENSTEEKPPVENSTQTPKIPVENSTEPPISVENSTQPGESQSRIRLENENSVENSTEESENPVENSTGNNDKGKAGLEGKKKKNKKRNFSDSEKAARIFKFWQKRMKSPRSIFTDDRERKIKAMLKVFSYSECLRAIIGCSNADFYMGRTEQNRTLYNEFERIFKKPENTEKFIRLYIGDLRQKQGVTNGTSSQNGSRNGRPDANHRAAGQQDSQSVRTRLRARPPADV